MENNKKDGVSVKEFETYAKKHRFELFFCLLFVLATFFTLIFWGPTFSIFCAGVGAIVALFIGDKIGFAFRKTVHFVLQKEKMMQMVLGIVFLLVAIFIPPFVFLVIGFAAGKNISHLLRQEAGSHK